MNLKSVLSNILTTTVIIMKRNKNLNNSQFIFILFSLFLLEMINGYPIEKATSQPDLKDETRYSNGTIIGKYVYTDQEGNPIHVKYYADDGSYGVELKRLKISETNTDEPNSLPIPKEAMDILKPFESPFGLNLAKYELPKPYFKNKYKIKERHLKNQAKNDKNYAKTSLQYEIFYQNNLPLQGPSPCRNDKVKVYLDKPNRITRNVDEAEQAAKYCAQF